MKTITVTVISVYFIVFPMFLIANSKNTQEDKKPGIRYKVNSGITFYMINLDSLGEITQCKQTAFPLLFTIPNTNIVNGRYTEVKFFDILATDSSIIVFNMNGSGKKDILQHNKQYINSSDNGNRFFIKTDELNRYLEDGNIELQYKTWWPPSLIYGATLATPFKFRPKIAGKNYTFSPELSLGPFIGINFRMDHTLPIYLNAIVSGGINSVNINTTVQKEQNNQDGLALGFYASTGLIFQVNDFQVGVLYGCDWVSGEMGANWIYNEKPWYSFSIGYNFLSNINHVQKVAKQQKKILNDQLILMDILKDTSISRFSVQFQENGSYTIDAQKLAKQNLNTENRISNIPNDSIASSNLLLSAKIINNQKDNSFEEQWVYIGEYTSGILKGNFGVIDTPINPGTRYQAKTAVYIRSSSPMQLDNGEWEVGKIIGVVEEGEYIKIYEIKTTQSGQYVWAKIN